MGCSGSKAAAKPSTTEAVAPAPAPVKEAQAVTLEAEAQVGISENDPYMLVVKRDSHNLPHISLGCHDNPQCEKLSGGGVLGER